LSKRGGNAVGCRPTIQSSGRKPAARVAPLISSVMSQAVSLSQAGFSSWRAAVASPSVNRTRERRSLCATLCSSRVCKSFFLSGVVCWSRRVAPQSMVLAWVASITRVQERKKYLGFAAVVWPRCLCFTVPSSWRRATPLGYVRKHLATHTACRCSSVVSAGRVGAYSGAGAASLGCWAVFGKRGGCNITIRSTGRSPATRVRAGYLKRYVA
jgi:hypothetical protein